MRLRGCCPGRRTRRSQSRAARQHRGHLGVRARRARCRTRRPRSSSSPPRTSAAPAPAACPRRCGSRPTCRWRARARASTPSARAASTTRIANKLLVLIDGRTVYYAAVLRRVLGRAGRDAGGRRAHRGDQRAGRHAVGRQRGQRRDQRHHAPVGTTRRAGLSRLEPATLDRGAALRFGGKLGENGSFRVYGRGFDLQNTRRADGTSLPDGSERGAGGISRGLERIRSQPHGAGRCLSGPIEERPVGGAVEVAGMNLLARWSQRLQSGSDIQVQAYLDRAQRDDHTGFQGDVDTFDLQFQHAIPLGRHRVLWGPATARPATTCPRRYPRRSC